MTELKCPNCGGKQFNACGGLRQCVFCDSEFLVGPMPPPTRTKIRSRHGSSTSSTTTMTSSTSSTTTTFPYTDEWSLVVENTEWLENPIPPAVGIISLLALLASLAFLFVNLLGGMP